MQQPSHRSLLAGAALLGLLAAAPPAAQAQLQGPRHELALQWAPAGLSNGDQRSRVLAYDRNVGNGFALGASLGYGDVHRGDSEDGAYLLLRVRKRFEPLGGGLNWIQPQIGIEYGGATSIFRNAELTGAYAGVYMPASTELGFTVDAWFGRSRDKEVQILGGGQTTVSRNVRNIRLGIALNF
jgi:hypothetical protein